MIEKKSIEKKIVKNLNDEYFLTGCDSCQTPINLIAPLVKPIILSNSDCDILKCTPDFRIKDYLLQIINSILVAFSSLTKVYSIEKKKKCKRKNATLFTEQGRIYNVTYTKWILLILFLYAVFLLCTVLNKNYCKPEVPQKIEKLHMTLLKNKTKTIYVLVE